MSELTQCNYCTYEHMKAEAKKRNVTVVLERSQDGWTSARYSDEKEPSAWFLKLTRECVC